MFLTVSYSLCCNKNSTLNYFLNIKPLIKLFVLLLQDIVEKSSLENLKGIKNKSGK